MSEQTVVVESSSTPAVEIDRGPLVNLTGDQRAEYRRTGELPEPPKKEESAPSSAATPEGEAQTAGESETPKQQENTGKKQNAETRKAQLSAEIQSLLKERDRLKAEVSTAKTQPAASSPAKVEPPKPQQSARTKPTAEDKDQQGNPKYKSYEDFVEDLADWKAEQRWTEQQRIQIQQAQAREFGSKVEEAKSRYGEKFSEVVEPTAQAIKDDAEIPLVVKTLLAESEILPDLVYTIGSDPKELASFVQMAKTQPGKALRYIALTESLIRETLSAKPAEKTTPAKSQTAAPKPPSEVGGRASTPGDQLESAAKAGDFRAFKAEANRRALAQLRG